MVQKNLNMGRYYHAQTKSCSMLETYQGNSSPACDFRLWQDSRNEMQVQCWVFLLNTWEYMMHTNEWLFIDKYQKSVNNVHRITSKYHLKFHECKVNIVLILEKGETKDSLSMHCERSQLQCLYAYSSSLRPKKVRFISFHLHLSTHR